VVKMASLIFNEAIKRNAFGHSHRATEHGAVVSLPDRRHAHPAHGRGAKTLYVPLTSRIKIMADLDIAEKRVPQDGRIRYDHNGEVFDFRVSTLPTHHGGKNR